MVLRLRLALHENMQPTLFEWEHCVDRFWRKKKGSVVQQSWLSLRAIWHHPARWCVGQSDTSKCSFRVLITRVLYYSFLPRNLCMKDKMAVHVIRRSKFQPHNIINPCEVFWHLTSLQTHGSVTQTPLSGLNVVLFSPNRKGPHRHSLCLCLYFTWHLNFF